MKQVMRREHGNKLLLLAHGVPLIALTTFYLSSQFLLPHENSLIQQTNMDITINDNGLLRQLNFGILLALVNSYRDSKC